MGGYQRERDEHALPMYEFTCQLATMEPPPPEVQQLFGAMWGNQRAMDGFVQMMPGRSHRRNSSRPRTSVRSWPRPDREPPCRSLAGSRPVLTYPMAPDGVESDARYL